MAGNPDTTDRVPEYTREEMREACRNNYNAALEKAAKFVCESQWDGTGVLWRGILAMRELQNGQ